MKAVKTPILKILCSLHTLGTILLLLLNSDNVTLIKDLKVRGSSMVLKRGTKVKSIRLTDNHEEVDSKIDGTGLVLKTCLLKKL